MRLLSTINKDSFCETHYVDAHIYKQNFPWLNIKLLVIKWFFCEFHSVTLCWARRGSIYKFERRLKCTSPKQSVISQQQQHKENGYICFAADTRFIIKGPATTLACYLFIARSIPLQRILNYTSFLWASGGERKKKRGETESIIQSVFGSVCVRLRKWSRKSAR